MAEAALRAETFTTAGVPSGRRSSKFSKDMASLFSIGLNIRPVGSQALECAVDGFARPGLRFAKLRFSPHITEPVSSQPSPVPSYLVSVHREGTAFVSQGGRESMIRPGDMFLVDPARPFMIETGEICTTSIYVPCAALRSYFPNVDSCTAIAMQTNTGPAALFRAYSDELFRIGMQLNADAAEKVADTIPLILSTVLCGMADDFSPVSAGCQAAHRQRVLTFIRQNLAEADLSPSLIARNVGLSLRYLYELFEGDAEPLMRRIWRERLDRCKGEIVHPQMTDISIGEIAFRWGFNDASHFSRAFRRRFGMAPREARSVALGGATLSN